jgi:hypothetical protein
LEEFHSLYISNAKLAANLVGIARATVKFGLANLVYNIKRLLFLRRIAVE